MRQFLVLLFAVALARSVCADAVPETEEAAAARIKATIEQRFSGSTIEAVHASATIPGWYEIITPDEIVYTDSRADFLLVGKLIDTRSRTNLTEKRLNELHAIEFKSLPLQLALKTVRGNGSRTVAIFEDPNCPYCQQLEHNIKDVTDVTIYTFLYPLEELHSGATARARAIWCASDRSAAWTKWMQERVDPGTGTCKDDPLATLQTLGSKLKIAGTPMIFFSDGHRQEGAISRESMEQQLGGDEVVSKR